MRDKLAFVLMEKIIGLIKDSGANRREALSAVRAVEAMLPEVELETATTMDLET